VAQESRWYVLQTMAGHEGVVLDQVKGVLEWGASFFPHRVETSRGQSRRVGRFPCYLFVRLQIPVTPYWETINTLRGAVHMLPRMAERPTPLPVGFVEGLIALYKDGEPDEDELEQALSGWAHGDQLRIESGPFEGHVGSFERRAKGRVELLVSLLGREFVLPVPAHQVSKAVVAPRGEDDRRTRTRAAHSPQFGRHRGERLRPEAASVV
jgi:transcription antitermination factor NusG